MENFRKAMYDACRQMDMEIVPIDIGARVMAYVGLQGGDDWYRQGVKDAIKVIESHI